MTTLLILHLLLHISPPPVSLSVSFPVSLSALLSSSVPIAFLFSRLATNDLVKQSPKKGIGIPWVFSKPLDVYLSLEEMKCNVATSIFVCIFIAYLHLPMCKSQVMK